MWTVHENAKRAFSHRAKRCPKGEGQEGPNEICRPEFPNSCKLLGGF